MEQIPDINIGSNLNIRDLQVSRIPEFYFPLIYSTPQTPPVSLTLGTPIIELPGCVEFNRANKESQNNNKFN